MAHVNISQIPFTEKVVAAGESASLIRKHYPGEATLTQLTGELDTLIQKIIEGFGGLDTRRHTREIEEKDEARDDADRAATLYLQALLHSRAHQPMWEAASALLTVIAGDGLEWLNDSYNAQSLRQADIIGRLATMAPQIETCNAGVFVEQIVGSQAEFEAAREARSQLQYSKPEIVGRSRRPFELTLRTLLLRLESLPDSPARQTVLEPFARLTRKTPRSPAPTPTDPV